jgi:hypothetical protein
VGTKSSNWPGIKGASASEVMMSNRKGMDMKVARPDDNGNEPAPLMLIAVAFLPLFAAIGWFVFG